MLILKITDALKRIMTTSGFEKTLDLLQRTMSAQIIRQEVIANNIANADTPHFKRTVVNFESALKRALQQEGETHFRASRTDPRHRAFREPIRYQEVAPRRVLDFQTTAKNNNNNVDIEVESALLLQNQLQYSLLSNSVGRLFQRVNIVLR